jgi:hypothetical protein
MRKPRKECLSRAILIEPESESTHASLPLDVYFLFCIFIFVSFFLAMSVEQTYY